MKIITNNQARNVIEGYELTEKERKEFDYIDWDKVEKGENSTSFIRYKGELYDLNDTERSTIEGWDAMVTETFFSGILFRYEGLYDVVCGRYYT